jgi:anoctamin-10
MVIMCVLDVEWGMGLRYHAEMLMPDIEISTFSEDIRKYFGDSIALYFSFLGFYTVSLIGPAILGICQFILPEAATAYTLVFFCIFNVVWVTITQELWKRKCSELAYIWGTLRMTKWEDPRSNHRGVMRIDPVTGRYQPVYPWWKTATKVQKWRPLKDTCLHK